MRGKKIAFIGIMAALSSIAFLIENLFPPLFVPGAKLGLGNIFILLTLIYLDFGSALIALSIKCLIAAMFGGFSTLIYSLPAGIVSLTLSFLLLNQSKRVSVVAISLVAAVVNNLIQNVVFVLVTKTVNVLLYAPYLALLGCLSGVVTGLVTFFILRKISTYVIKKLDFIEN